MTEERIANDLKAALLARDSFRATVLRGIRGSILNVKVAEGKRDVGLDEQQVTAILAKEAKKRQESIALYEQAGDKDRAQQERDELAIVQQYLPEQLDEAAIAALVDAAITEVGSATQQDMGRIIGIVRAKAAGAADGALIARLVKERLV